MTDTLHASIARLITNAQQTEASEKRSKLFDRYMGEPYGDEVDGRSAFISTDVADAVEAILPDIMDAFTSTEGLIEFQPIGPEDEEAARQETEVVEHIFWEKNNGFAILLTWFKEALIQQNSYVRHSWDERERIEIEEYADLDADEIMAILGQKDAAGVEYEAIETEDNDDGTVNITLRCATKEKRYIIECIPQEEFFHTPRWHKVSLDGIPCCGHRKQVERGELLRMGFDPESVDAAADDGDWQQTEERFETRDSFEDDPDAGDESTRLVTVYEAYVRADINGDDRAELVRVWASGDGSTILKWANGDDAIDEVSALPFACLTPYIIPHRHIGRSVSEQVDDIQRVKTVLIRHTLDNVYLTNYPRPEFDETLAGPNTYEDLANPAPGKPIRTGGVPITWQRPPSVIDTTLPIIQGMDDLKESRIGATRYNQGIDAESLNKTASGVQMIMNAGQKKTLLIARTFAETGLRDLFLGIHRSLRAGPLKALAVKLRGQWTTVNPRVWADRTDMTVKVGGNSRETKRNAYMLMGQIQRELLQGGSRIVNEGHIYALTTRMMQTFGMTGADEFMDDPATIAPAQPQPPGPQEQAMAAQMQLQAADMQRRTQKDQMDHQARMAELQLKSRELALREVAEAAKIDSTGERIDLDRNKAVMDDDFKRDKLEIDALTGLHRQAAQAVTSTPPMDYSDV